MMGFQVIRWAGHGWYFGSLDTGIDSAAYGTVGER